MTHYTLSETDIQAYANNAVALVLAGLREDNVLTEEQYNEVKDYYGIVLHKKGWFGKFLGRLWEEEKQHDNDITSRLVRFKPSIKRSNT